jgi:hypothetical protein
MKKVLKVTATADKKKINLKNNTTVAGTFKLDPDRIIIN